MTTPRFWTDPLSGATYPFAGRLQSDHFNAYLAGWRALDHAFEWFQAINWQIKEATITNACVALGYDQKWKRIMLIESTTGDTSPNMRSITLDGTYQADAGAPTAPTGGWTTTSIASIASNSTTTVVGAATVNASNQKVATLQSDGFGWDIRSMSNAEAGVGPGVMIWDPSNELFIAGINGTGATGKIETSPDGVTWTARTVSTVATPSAMATDGNGTTVVLLSGATAVAQRSTDGITWSNVTMPASTNWSSIVYVPGLGKWFASDGSTTGSTTNMNANYASSTNGQTWVAESIPTGWTYPPLYLATLGNLIFAAPGYGANKTRLYVSADGDFFTTCNGVSTATHIATLFGCQNFVAHLDSNGTYLSASGFAAIA